MWPWGGWGGRPWVFHAEARPVLQAYRPLRTFIALVGLEVWSGGDQISVTPPAGATLEAFRRWRNDQLLKRKKHDNAHLIRWEAAAGLGGFAAAVGMETGRSCWGLVPALTLLVAFQRDRL